jgi:hypothetical protein
MTYRIGKKKTGYLIFNKEILMNLTRLKGAKGALHVPWGELLYYDESSPTAIRHNRDIKYGNGNTIYKARKGDIAGSLAKSGYFVYSSSAYGLFQVHRVVWILVNKIEIPNNVVIDHIDGDKTNNIISNLRLVDESLNARNAKLYSNNTTGIVGVYFDTKISKNNKNINYYWKASWISIDGIQKTKVFSVSKFGLIPAMKMAAIFRLKQIEIMNLQGAGYTERHGK